MPTEFLQAFIAATPAQREAALRALTEPVKDEQPLDDMEVVTRPQLAHFLKCSVNNVDYHRRKGRLVPVYIKGSSRIRGFTRESVRALLSGAAGKAVR